MPQLPLDMRRLRYFRAIAREGSISAAARQLHISQPALTHHMSDLEAALDLILLERSSKGITLTEAGTALLRNADIILEAVDRAEAELRGLAPRAGPRRSLRLAVISSLAPTLTPVILEAVARQMPGTLIEVVDGRTNLSREWLARGQIDFAVIIGDKKNAGVPLVQESLFLITRPGDEPRAEVRTEDLGRLPLVIPARTNPLREFVEELAREAGIRLNVVAEVSGIDSRKQAVMAGIGTTLLPYHTVARECEAGRLRAIPFSDSPKMRLIVLEHRADLDAATVSAMRDILVPLLPPILEGHTPSP
jgi:LysR family nitrogen assimilation transcriptional regulator